MSDTNVVSLEGSAGAAEASEVLKRDGVVILRELVAGAEIDAMMAELDPYLDARPTSEGEFVGASTKRVHGLLGKSRRVGDLLLNPTVLGVMDEILGPWCQCYQMSSLSLTSIGPGQAPQELHRDDALYPIAHPLDRESEVTAFWALSDFTVENGATQVVPGSHRWDDERKPTPDEVAYAVMPKGSVCIFLGSTYHGGGRNVTEDGWRTRYVFGLLPRLASPGAELLSHHAAGSCAHAARRAGAPDRLYRAPAVPRVGAGYARPLGCDFRRVSGGFEGECGPACAWC